MKKLLLAGLVVVFCAGCMGLHTMGDEDRPLGNYDIVFGETYKALKSYGMIVGCMKHQRLGYEGPGLIIAELPRSTDLGFKTRTRIYAFVTPYNFGYADINIRVAREVDTSEPSMMTHGPEKNAWEEVDYDEGLEVKIHNEILNKLAGVELKTKKKLVIDKYESAEKPLEALKPTQSEQEIEAALAEVVSVNLANKSLDSAIGELRKLSGVNIVVTKAALDFADREKVSVSFEAKGVQFRNVLNLLTTAKAGLTWDVRFGVILIDVRQPKVIVKPAEEAPQNEPELR